MARRTTPQSFAEMRDEHLACRSLLHPWDIDPDVKYTEVRKVKGRKSFVLPLVCLRCGAHKELKVWATGEDAGRPIKGGITYPDGYLVKGLGKNWGGRGALLANARLELFERYSK